jgi:hypothetical protein
MCSGTRNAFLSKLLQYAMSGAVTNLLQSVECSVWYASPHRVLLVIPAAKTPTFRHELRYAPTRHQFAKLPTVKCFATAKCHPGTTKPTTSYFELRSCESILCHPHHVARSRCQLLPTRSQERMGSGELLNGRPVDVQAGTMSCQQKVERHGLKGRHINDRT